MDTLWELYSINEEGFYADTIGYFRDKATAKAALQHMGESIWRGIRRVNHSHLIFESLEDFQDRKDHELLERALAKLSPKEETALMKHWGCAPSP